MLSLHSPFAHAAATNPQTITVDGRLFDGPTSETPLIDPSVVINVKIYDPGKTCVLYEENQTVNTTASQGRFTIQVGSNTGDSKRTGDDPGNAMAKIFQNTSLVPATNTACAAGYTPAVGAQRYMRITVSPSTTGAVEVLSPDTQVDSVPTALVAETLQGLGPTDFLRLNTTPELTQTNVEGVFSAPNYSKLTSLLTGASGDYVRANGSGATIPGFATAPSSPTNGQMWFDTATGELKFKNAGGVQTIGTGGGSVTSVDLSMPSIFSVSGGPVTGAGTLTATLANQNAGVIFAGPTTGSAAPSFRALASTDLPAGGYDSTYARLDGNTVAATMTIGTNNAFGLSFRTGGVSRMIIDTNGKVGVGTTTPETLLDVAGAVRLGNDASTCATPLAGAIRYTGTNVEYCNGSAWQAFATSSAAISSIGGLTATTQVLTTGVSGTSPNWTTSGLDTHVFNIPMASSAGVTAGLISKTDYDAFNAKLGTSLATGKIWVGDGGGVATAVTPSGDVTVDAAGAFTVVGLQGKSIDATAPSSTGQVLRWDNTASKWTPSFLNMADIHSVAAPGSPVFPLTSCTADKTLHWNSLSDTFDCQLIGIASSQITYASVQANKVFAGPASGPDAAPTYRALTSSDLPSGGYDSTYFKQGGSAFGAPAILGTNESQPLSLHTNSVERLTITTSGQVGVGTNAPTAGTLVDFNGVGTAASSLLLPRDTVANRPATGVNGMIRYNTDANTVEIFAGSAWSSLATATAGGYLPLSGGTMTGAINMGGQTLQGSNTASGALTLDSTSNAAKGVIALNPSGGNVGVGTMSPSGALDVANSTAANSALILRGAASQSAPLLDLKNSSGTTLASVTSSGRVLADGGSAATPGLSFTGATAPGLFIGSSNSLGFSTNGAEVMRLDTNGNLGLGTSTITSGAIAEFNGTTTANSSVLLPRATSALRPATGVNGMLRYNTDNEMVEVFANGAWTTLASATTGGYLPLSGGTMTGAINMGGQTLQGSNTASGSFTIDSTSNATKGNILLNTGGGAVGFGTTSPTAGAIADFNGTGAGLSSLVVPRDTVANRPATGVNGMLRYATDTNKLESYINGSWQPLLSGAATSPLSSLTAATTTNTIDSLNFAQTWNWSTASTQTPLSMNANGLTTGSILNLATSNATVNSTNGLLNVANTGASTSGMLARFQSNSTAGSGLSILTNGSIGVGTDAPVAALDVATTGTNSAVVLPRDTTANRPVTNVASGMIRYNTTLNKFEAYENGAWTNMIGGASSNVALSGLTAATTTNTIDSLNFAQTWNWSTATTQTPLAVNANALTTGGVLNIATSNGTLNSTNGLLSIANTGASTTGLIAKFQANSTAGSGLYVLANGQLGVGTAAPAAGAVLDLNGTGTGASSLILPRDTVANRPATGVNGMIRYASDTNKLESYINGSWQPLLSGSATSPLSSLTAATATNTIDSLNFAQTWNWSTASTQTPLSMNADGLTTGSILNLATSNATVNSTDGLLNVANTGASTSGNIARFQANSTAGSGLYILASGKVGIGTAAPTAGTIAEFNGTGAAASSILVPRDTVANRPATGVNGMLRYASDTNKLESYINGSWQPLLSGAATSPLSSLTAATATNTIDSLNFAQTWNWSTATTQTPLVVNANALTTGSVLSLATSNATVNSTNGLLNVANTGASTSGMLARFQANSTAGSGLSILANGSVGVGTDAPVAALDVATTGTNSAVVLPRDTTANRPVTNVASGMIRYNTTLNKFEAYENGAWTNMIGGASSNVALSGLTAATATNTIDSLNFAQTWNWSTATTQTPLAANANALTTGSVLSLATSNATVNSTNGLLSVANTGASTTGLIAKFQANSTAGSGMYILASGKSGFGTASPTAGTIVDFNGTGAANSSILVPRDTVANRPATGVNGMLRYATDTDKLESYINGSWQPLLSGAATSPLSSLTASTATNTIDSLNFAQTWNWSTASTQTPLSVNANGLTTGSILNLATSNASVNSTNGLLNVANTGASTSGNIARFQANSTAGSGMYILASGKTGFGTASPTAGTIVDFNGTGAANSSILVPRDTVANRPATGVNGMLRYASDTNQLESYINGSWQPLLSGAATSPLSSLTAATTTNTIDSLNFAQTWNWSTATTQTPLAVNANALTTGSVMSLATSNATVNSTNGLLNVANTGASTSGMLARFQSNSTAGSGLSILTNGSIGVGTDAPVAALDVASTGTNSAVVLPRDTTANRPVTNVASGMIRYNTTLNKFEAYENGAWTNMIGGASSNVALSGLTAATTTNTIDSLNFAQTWNWSTATTQTPLSMNANGLTTGSILNLATSNASVNSTNGLLTVANTGASTTGLIAKFQANSTAGSGMYILASGKTGFGTASPTAGTIVDFNGTGTAASSILVPRDTVANRPATGVNGMLRYASDTNQLESYINGSWQPLLSGAATSPLSSLTAATATNTIDSLNFAQTWNWSTATTQTPLTVNANALTTGSMLSLATSNASVNSTAGLLNVANTGASTSGMLARFQANSTASSGMSILANGRVGVGTSSPQSLLDVYGDLRMSGPGYTFTMARRDTNAAAWGLFSDAGELSVWSFANSVERMVISASGNVGIGTTAPAAGLDVAITGTNSAVVLPRDTTANRPSSNVASGMIRYNTTLNKFEAYENGAWTNMIGGTSSNVALSGLTAATATNTIDSLNFAQTWNWSTATTQTPLSMNANGLTTGSILNLATSNASVNSTNGLLTVANTGASTTGLIAKFQANSTAGSGMYILASGKIGFGTASPTAGTIVDFNGTGTAASSILVPRDTVANRPATGVNGMLRYATDTDKLESYINGSWQPLLSGAATSPLSSLTAATATNTIDSLNFAQTWNWSTASTQTPLAVNANALTTGSILNLATSNASVNSTNGLLNVANTGASTSGMLARFQSNSTAGSGLYVLANGRTGIGTNAPVAALDVATTGTDSAVVLPRDTTANRPSSNVASGMIRYNTTLNKFEAYENGAWTNMIGGASSNVALSGLTAATTTNTIDSLNFAQTWNWSTATTQTPLTVNANALTTGGILNLATSNASVNSTNGLLTVANTGASTTGLIAKFQANSTAGSGMYILASGKTGFGTASPTAGTIVDFNGTGTAASSILVPRDTVANRPATGVNGMLRYASDTNKLESYINGSWQPLLSGSATSPLSSLTAATATNTIDSLNFAQTWNWSTATTQTPLTVNANALTTGSLLSLATSNTSVNSTGGLLNVANTGSSTSGMLARFQSNSTAGSGMTILASGSVGIGNATPGYPLDLWNTVSGAESIPLNLQNSSTTNGAAASIAFSVTNSTANPTAKISNIRVSNADRGLAFSTYNGSLNEALRINGAGSVGIGTTSPSWKLSVAGGVNGILNHTTDWVYTTTGSGIGMYSGAATGNTYGAIQNYNSGGSATGLLALNPTGGNVGIGTTAPASGLDVASTGVNSAVILPRDTTANRPLTNVTNGMIRYNTTLSKFEAYENGAWTNMIGGASSSVALSGLTAATTTNTIDSLNFAQTWNWSTATTQTPLTMNVNALTTGSILSLATSNASVNSTNGLLSVANTGASTSGTIAKIQANSTAGSGLYVLANGNVGIGTATPATPLNLAGATGAKFRISDNSTGSNFIDIENASGVGYISVNAAQPLTFATSATERMRISATGNVGIGTNSPSSVLDIRKNVTGSTNSYSVNIATQGQSDVTGNLNGVVTVLGTAASNYNVVNLSHFAANQGTFGNVSSGGTITNQAGFNASANLVGATNNYGFSSNLAAGTNRWNFYAGGTADNYFAGKVGIGTISPASALDIATTGTNSAVVLPRDTTANRPSSNVASGMIRYNTTLNKFEAYENGAWTNMIGGTSSNVALSGLTAATATNTIDNLNFDQTWNWSTATTQSPLSISANALTTGSLLNLTSSNTSLNSTNGLLNVANTGSSTSGLVAKIQSNSTAGSGLYVLANGNVGIGTNNPSQRLTVQGAASTAATFFLQNSDYVSTTTGSGFYLQTAGTSGNVGTNFQAFTAGNSGSGSINLNPYGGSVGIGTTTPAVDGNTATYLTVEGGSNIGEISVGRNQSGTTNGVGLFNFTNSNIGVADKRIAAIGGWTDGATNSGNIQFFTSNAGSISEKMRINKTGYVGIGTTSPNNLVEIGAGVLGALTGGGNVLAISNASANSTLALGQGTGNRGRLTWVYNVTAASAYMTLGVSSGTNPLALQESGGNIGVGGNINPTTALQVTGVISPTTDNTYALGTSSLRFSTVYAVNSVIQTSDVRQKKEIEPTDLGLGFINQLRPVSYRWTTGKDTDRHYGLIAQETEKVLMEHSKDRSPAEVLGGIVTYDKESDRYGIRYTELISPIIQAVQDLYKMITRTDAKVEALEQENARLKAENQAQDRKAKELEKRLERLEKAMEKP